MDSSSPLPTGPYGRPLYYDLDGVPLSRAPTELDAFDPATRRRLAEELLLAVLRQLLVTGIFHADLHGGNVMLLRDGRLPDEHLQGELTWVRSPWPTATTCSTGPWRLRRSSRPRRPSGVA